MLRIVTLNLNYYIEKHGPWVQRKQLIIDQLREKNPHIVAFQAVAKHPELHQGKDQAFQLCESLDGFQSHYYEAAQTQTDGLVQGNAVISKFPMHEKSFVKLSRIAGHDDNNDRIVQRVSFHRPSGNFDLYNAHFSWVDEQAKQNVAEATEFMKRGNAPALLAGDLNTLSASPAFKPFNEAAFVDAWEKSNSHNSGFTFESDNPSIRIDYFWLSPSLANQLNKVEILSPPAGSPARFSDHLGLMLELNIKV